MIPATQPIGEFGGPGALAEDGEERVTCAVAGQAFGLPIGRVHDVFVAGAVTEVPLAPPQVAGLLSHRGRVVTAICLRRLLGLRKGQVRGPDMALRLEHRGESYALLVDSVGDVIRLLPQTLAPVPPHLDPRWAALSRGVHRLEAGLLLLLDVDALLTPPDRPTRRMKAFPEQTP